MKILVVIPARGGSKRLPRKNIYPLCGRPLISYAIEACKNSKVINADNIYVSTEDDEIARVSLEYGAKIIDRPPALAEDHAWTQDVLSHALEWSESETGNEFDVLVRVQANSPQVTSEKIDECIQKLQDHNLWEVFTVDEEGIEDAAIHVMLRKCVNQKALSVYKGVVVTDYIDVHTKEDIEKISKKLRNKNDN